jgi:SAM-dependent methyltransferase
MSELKIIQPTSSTPPANELERWERLFAGDDFYYGLEPGPLARRVVRYHRVLKNGGTALDAGCGEGQDLLFLAQCGYNATGLDFTSSGAHKARRLLQENGVSATVLHGDLRTAKWNHPFDIVIAANVLQFLGSDAPNALHQLKNAVAPGGIIGLSLFARRPQEPAINGSLYRAALPELLQLFADWQPLEAAQLWQWNTQSGAPQPFVTLIARRVAPVAPIEMENFR